MKTRIRSHEIRLRLTQAEATLLLDGKPVEDTVPLGTDACWCLTVRTGDAASLVVDQGFSLVVPHEHVTHWLASDDEGFQVTLGPTRFSIEKDYACKRPRTEDDDTFPNPEPGRC